MESVFTACAGHASIVLDGNLKRRDTWAEDWIFWNACGGNPDSLVAEGYGLCAHGDSTCYDYERTFVSGGQLICLPRGSDPLQYSSFVGNPSGYRPDMGIDEGH